MRASIGRRILALALSACLSACLSGCCVYACPTVRYVRSTPTNAPRDSVRAFRCDTKLIRGGSLGRYVRVPFRGEIEPISMENRDTTGQSLGVGWEYGLYRLPILGGMLTDGLIGASDENFVLLHRPGYRSVVVEAWDLSPDPLWTPTQSVEEEEMALDEMLCVCDEFPWSQGSTFAAVPWSLDAPSEPRQVPNPNKLPPPTPWESLPLKHRRQLADKNAELMRYAAAEYERVLLLAQQLTPEQVLMPYDAIVDTWLMEPAEREAFLAEDSPCARRREVVERLQWKIAWLHENLGLVSRVAQR